MRKFFKPAFRKSNKRIQNNRHDYGMLEDRRLLAILTSFDSAAGHLTIDLTGSHDGVVIGVQKDSLSITGDRGTPTLSAQTDFAQTDFAQMEFASQTVFVKTELAKTEFVQPELIAVADVQSIEINGDPTGLFQSVVFNSDFSNAGGADLQSISVSDVNMITFNGFYELAGDFTATLDGSQGQITDSDAGRLVVGGVTEINARKNDIVLNNEKNDFVGPVSLRAGLFFAAEDASLDDRGQLVQIADGNDIEFADVFTSGDWSVKAVGDITDTNDSVINVADLARLSAANVYLGNNSEGATNIGRVTINAPGHVELFQDNSVSFINLSNMGSLELNSGESIYDGLRSVINVTGRATLRADAHIRIGDSQSDVFNAGELNFNSEYQVEIFESSATRLVGDNTAGRLNLSSVEDITDANDATVNVTYLAGFSAENLYLGDTATDEFNAGEIQFLTKGDMFLSENSGIHISHGDNYANRLELESAGAISDADDAFTTVTTLSRFEAVIVVIGDSDTDGFQSGWISFNTHGRTFIYENSSTHIANQNSAGKAVIVSTGEIANGRNTIIEVSGSTAFAGAKITIGNRSGDRLAFGGLLLNSPGAATVFEDDNTVFMGSSSVDLLRMNSLGGITDGSEASLNVARVASFHAATASITLGDSSTDEFNATALMANASNGVVNISEDSGMLLTGATKAKSLILAAQGNITDTAFATLDIDYLLDVTGHNIYLDNDLSFRSVNFNSVGNTSITSRESMTLIGDNSVGATLTLESAHNIYDATEAQTSANQAFFTAVDIVLGDTWYDCLDVLPENLVVNASGVENVTIGCVLLL